MKDAEDLWLFPHVYCYCLVAKSCPALCNPIDCSLPGSSVHGIFQTSKLEKVAISFSRGSLWPRDQTHISCMSLLHCRRILYHWPTREAFCIYYTQANNLQKIIEKHIKWLKHKEPLYLQLISKKIFFKNVHISFKILKCFKSLFQQIGLWEYSLISSKQDSVKLFSRVWLLAISWTVSYQAPPSMEFSRQEYCSGLPFPSQSKTSTY